MKNPKTFLFFQRKKKQKNLTSATSASGGLALVPAFENSQGAGSIFLKKPLKKSPPLNPCKLSFCPIFREYRKPYSASKKIYSSFGVKFYRTKPLNKKRHENNLSYLLYLIYIFFSNKLPVYFFHFVIC